MARTPSQLPFCTAQCVRTFLGVGKAGRAWPQGSWWSPGPQHTRAHARAESSQSAGDLICLPGWRQEPWRLKDKGAALGFSFPVPPPALKQQRGQPPTAHLRSCSWFCLPLLPVAIFVVPPPSPAFCKVVFGGDICSLPHSTTFWKKVGTAERQWRGSFVPLD